MSRRAFVTSIEVTPSGEFSAIVATEINIPRGSRISLNGAVKAQGSRVWIEADSDLVERALRPSQLEEQQT
jgi:hypothetical protein